MYMYIIFLTNVPEFRAALEPLSTNDQQRGKVYPSILIRLNLKPFTIPAYNPSKKKRSIKKGN